MVSLLLDPNYLSLCMSFGGGVGLYSAGFEPDLYSIFPFTCAIIHAPHDQFFHSSIHPSFYLACYLSIYLSIGEQMHEWKHTGSRI
jgi:hypothetical protein